MRHDPETASGFDAMIRKAILEGKDGREEIVRQLSSLPLEQLASVPSSALAMIGPEGLARLAAQRAEFAGLAPRRNRTAQGASITAPAVTTSMRSGKGWRLSPTVWFCASIVIAAMSFDRVAAIAGSWTPHASFSRNASDWPSCPRLDRYTDGCVYQTGGARLSLVGAAELLAMNVTDLAGLNRHLHSAGTEPLPAGSLIVVLRDRSRFTGRRS